MEEIDETSRAIAQGAKLRRADASFADMPNTAPMEPSSIGRMPSRLRGMTSSAQLVGGGAPAAASSAVASSSAAASAASSSAASAAAPASAASTATSASAALVGGDADAGQSVATATQMERVLAAVAGQTAQLAALQAQQHAMQQQQQRLQADVAGMMAGFNEIASTIERSA